MAGLIAFFQLVGLIFQWQEYVSLEGRFRVSVPDQMTLKVDKVKTAVGDLTYNTYYVQDKSENAKTHVYMVSYCDYPAGTFHSDSIDLINDFFETSIDAAKNSLNGQLMYFEKTTLEKNQGRIWRIDYNNGKAMAKTRAFIVDQRYYAVQTVGSLGLDNSSERFLNSFRFIPGG
jgi:hypothetical protein